MAESTNIEVEGICAACCWRSGEPILDRSATSGLIHLERIRSSVANGDCPCCRMVLEAVDKLIPNVVDSTYLRRNETTIEFLSHKIWVNCYASTRTKFSIEIFINTAEKPPHAIRRCRNVAEHTSSDESLEWVKMWLDHCLDKHERCGGRRVPPLPSRVIDVTPLGDQGDVRLIDGCENVTPSQYAALSHCWGKIVPKCCTTTQTLNEWKTRIPLRLLPPTFRDAVIFTRRLGIQYLWVDSMCIIQGDEEDWRKEAMKMYDVYGNAFITLAAAHSNDSLGGLFTSIPKHHRSYPLSPVILNGQSWQLFARKPLESIHSWTWAVSYGRGGGAHNLPLSTRAWSYQERLVSPRVILFTANELVWECLERVGCEYTGPIANSKAPGVPCVKGAQFMTSPDLPTKTTGCPKILHVEFLNQTRNSERWHEIVEEYSPLALSLNTDKFPAISAVAKQIQKLRPDEKYLAGLWSGTIGQDLLWFDARLNPEPALPRIAEAPTWSWASRPYGVSYRTTYRKWGNKFFVTLLQSDGKRRDNDDFGHVECFTLTLRAQLLKCYGEPRRFGLFSGQISHRALHPNTMFNEDDYGSMDEQHGGANNIFRPTSLYIMRVSEGPSEVEGYYCRHLVLRPVKSQGEEERYRRVGILDRRCDTPEGKALSAAFNSEKPHVIVLQ